MKRLNLGRRLAVYIEPRDIWVGVYVARGAVYVCPVPCLVFRWRRRQLVRVIESMRFDGTLADGTPMFHITKSRMERQ